MAKVLANRNDHHGISNFASAPSPYVGYVPWFVCDTQLSRTRVPTRPASCTYIAYAVRRYTGSPLICQPRLPFADGGPRLSPDVIAIPGANGKARAGAIVAPCLISKPTTSRTVASELVLSLHVLRTALASLRVQNQVYDEKRAMSAPCSLPQHSLSRVCRLRTKPLSRYMSEPSLASPKPTTQTQNMIHVPRSVTRAKASRGPTENEATSVLLTLGHA
jgi:hypothetical protein